MDNALFQGRAQSHNQRRGGIPCGRLQPAGGKVAVGPARATRLPVRAMGGGCQAEPAAAGRNPVRPHLVVRQRHLLPASQHRAPVPHGDGCGQRSLARSLAAVLPTGQHACPLCCSPQSSRGREERGQG